MSLSTANTQRRLRDLSLTKSIALPAAAATAVTGSVDFGTTILGPTGDEIEVEISRPATPALVDAKTITDVLTDSADNVTFAAIVGGPAAIVSTGAGGVGAPALLKRVRLPSNTRRYVRLESTVLAAGGDNTAVASTMAVLANN
jgi:hypothetical protein